MKKRLKLALIPTLATAVSAIVAACSSRTGCAATDAVLLVPDGDADALRTPDVRRSSNTFLGAGDDLFGFIVTQRDDGHVEARHGSHASHSSHASHYSSSPRAYSRPC